MNQDPYVTRVKFSGWYDAMCDCGLIYSERLGLCQEGCCPVCLRESERDLSSRDY